MTKKYIRNGILILMALMFAAISGFCAQNPPLSGKGKTAAHKKSNIVMDRKEVREMLQTMRVWELTKIIDLTEEQALKLFPLLNESDKLKEEARKNKDGILKELKALLKDPTSDNAKIELKLDAIEQIDTDSKLREDQIQEEIKKTLSPVQLARLKIFQKEFEDDVRKMILEIRSLKR